jgi:hypothetical protein
MQLGQDGPHRFKHRQVTSAGLSLGRSDEELAADALDLLTDPHRAGLEVNVAPPQSEHLAASQADPGPGIPHMHERISHTRLSCPAFLRDSQTPDRDQAACLAP